MAQHDHTPNDPQDQVLTPRPHCCPCGSAGEPGGLRQRSLLEGFGGPVAGVAALTGLSWSLLSAAEPEFPQAPARRPLVVQPIFTYPLPDRRPQTSWRSWGGIQTEQDVAAEAVRIRGELEKLKAGADFPLEFLPLAQLRTPDQLAKVADLAKADAILLYAAGDGGGDLMASINPIAALGKDTIIFVRHQSGPLYYWYEGVMARFLHQHTDGLAVKGIDYADVVVDSQDEILWRLRSLCGLRNTREAKILAIGGPGAWSGHAVPDLVKKLWKIDIQTVSYDELGKLIQAARQDQSAVGLAKKRTADYLRQPATALKTQTQFVENAFLLDQIFRKLMAKANCRAMTINSCMGTIMPLAETSACLTLSTLNDDGYLAFCESDFVVIPSGILCNGISGKPTFLNDPTYPHDGIITLAHCTGPRKMDGKTVEPAQIVTHFESDYGASPKVDMRIGQKVTNIAPDFKSERWVGLLGEIVAHPFLPICRCQIDIKYTCPDKLLAERMPGFHWMTIYGDYMKELGYALRRVPITWEALG